MIFLICFLVCCIILYISRAEISYPISWPICSVDQYPFGLLVRLQCYHSGNSRHSHQRTDESQILFQLWCYLYTRETTVDREQCPAARQTKQVPIAILHHWLQTSVAYCTKMNQSILKVFHLYHIHWVCISEVHEEECQRPSLVPMWMYLLDLQHLNFSPIIYYWNKLNCNHLWHPQLQVGKYQR